MRPYRSPTAANIASTWSGWRTSQPTARTLPWGEISAAVFSSTSRRRPQIARLAPRLTRYSPIDRPKPVPPPVMTIVWSRNDSGGSIGCTCRGWDMGRAPLRDGRLPVGTDAIEHFRRQIENGDWRLGAGGWGEENKFVPST